MMKSRLKKLLTFSLGVSLCLTNSLMMVRAKENENVIQDEKVSETINVASYQNDVNENLKSDNQVIEVPIEGMVITGGVYYGISKEWYTQNNPEGKVLNLSLTIPNNVSTINNDGFRDSWSQEKQNQKCITNYNYDGDKTYTDKYTVVNIDFSNATNLKEIKNQAAMGLSSLTGILDLSKTKVEKIGKSAFKECTGLTGVILPSTLKSLGDASSGGVFSGCSGLQFVRSADGKSDAIFELPDGLEIIGNQSFKECTGLPENTVVSIPASVTIVGSEAFYKTNSITTIFVETDDASQYADSAFKGENYGLGKRLTIFKNVEARKSFTPSGSNSYINSITYEFTLHYDTIKTETKLWGQAVNVCKNENGEWYTNANYVIPDSSINAPVGYTGGWVYNDSILTNKTVLKPSGDELTLGISYVLQEPTIQFIVDGQTIKSDDTSPKINLSNNKEHTIGVNVSHPIETSLNADVDVKFEYKWTDVWQGGKEGPRMSEAGFGTDGFGKPKGTNTITINGAEDERTTSGNYSDEDYGDGYYLLEIYGYSKPKSGGAWSLFYKSASTVIGSDSDRTTNTAYLFYVTTSDPAKNPEVTIAGDQVVYGYDNAELVASVSEIEGQTNTYQWYKATVKNQTTGGEKIDGAVSKTLEMETGKQAGEYYYYLEVTSKKELNGDVTQVIVPVTFTVEKAESHIEITTESMEKIYDGQSVSNPQVIHTGSTKEVVFTWYKKDSNGNWEKIDAVPVNAGLYKVVASVESDENYTAAMTEKEFVIKKAIPIPTEVSNLTIIKGQSLESVQLPNGYSWKDKSIVANDLGLQQFEAIFTPEDTENYETLSVLLEVEVILSSVDINQVPTINASDKTLKVGETFDPRKDVTATDKEDGDLTSAIEILENTVDTSKAGDYQVTYKVTDKDGASSTKTIKVIVENSDKNANNTPETSDYVNTNVWLSLFIVSGLLMGVIWLKSKKRI